MRMIRLVRSGVSNSCCTYVSRCYGTRPPPERWDLRGVVHKIDPMPKLKSLKRNSLLCQTDHPFAINEFPDNNNDRRKLQCEMSILENGLRIASMDIEGGSSAICVVSQCGPRREHGLVQKGTSSVLQSLLVASSTSARSAKQLGIDLDKLGIHLGFNVMETQSYYMQFIQDKLPEAIEILSNQLTNTSFLDEEIEDKKFVCAEIYKENQKSNEVVVHNHVNHVAFGDTDIGLSTIHTENDFLSVTKEDLKKLHNLYFSPNNLIIVGVGVNHSEFVKLIKNSYFSENRKQVLPPLVRPVYIGGTKALFVDERKSNDFIKDEATALLAFKGLPNNTDRAMELLVMQKVLGGGHSFSSGGPGKGMYTRIYKNILCYDFVDYSRCFITPFEDCGLFGVDINSVPPENIVQAIELIVAELQALTTINDVEFERAKNQTLFAVNSVYENQVVLAEDIGRHILSFGYFRSPEYYEKMLRNTTKEKVKQLAKEILSSKPSLVYRGPRFWNDEVFSQFEHYLIESFKNL